MMLAAVGGYSVGGRMETRDVPTVLIVDDDVMVLDLMKRQLAGLPLAIIVTPSASEAMAIVRKMEIAMLLCDLRMPGVDGNVVLACAREANPNIVSVLVTGMSDLDATVRAINEGGIWKYLAKPWSRDQLVNIVSDGVARYRTLCRQDALLKELARDITRGQDRLVDESDEVAVTRVPLLKRAMDFAAGRKPRLKAGGRNFLGTRYKLLEILGEGGTGSVYRAHDELLDMPVAIKVLGSRFTRDALAVSTLKEEARIAMQLSHRHIVRLHNLQKAGKHYFLVMEYVEGRTFRDVLSLYGKLPLETVRQVVQVCADALSYAHRHGVLHKDLKPANILLSKDGVLKIIDFGVACLVHAQERSEHIVGTPIYMSPEQIRGETLDRRTDIYSLGIIIYQLLAGHPPFPELTMDLDLLARGTGPLLDVEPRLRTVLEKAVARRREERWESVMDFAEAFAGSA